MSLLGWMSIDRRTLLISEGESGTVCVAVVVGLVKSSRLIVISIIYTQCTVKANSVPSGPQCSYRSTTQE